MGLDQPFFIQFFRYTNESGSRRFWHVLYYPGSGRRSAAGPLPQHAQGCGRCDAVLCRRGSSYWGLLRRQALFLVLQYHHGCRSPWRVSLPIFWLGLLLILLFSVHLGWLPSSGLDSFASLILPSLALGSNYMANVMRTTRSSMLEVIRQDYIRTAKAKGVNARNVVLKHALQNAMMPTITVIGMNIGALLGGVVLTETVFSIPGTGRLLVESINKRDTPTVLGVW